MFVKGKFNFKHVQIWFWVFLLKEKLTSDMSKYDFEYVCQKKSWLWACPNIILNIFIKEKFEFRHVQIWLWKCLLKKNFSLDMSKYDIEYVCQKKSWL
jgi:hypothetical protein